MTKTLSHLIIFAFITAVVSSCLGNGGDDYVYSAPNAVVTVKTDPTNHPYLQLDEKTTLKPINMPVHPFDGKEVRALVSYIDKGDYISSPSEAFTFNRNVEINWIDSLVTKKPVPSLGEDEDDKKYGTAPIEIINNWITVVEDGYITICFCGDWGMTDGKIHFVNLLTGTDPEDPYTLELRHDANGDDISMGYRRLTGFIAFNIKDLPDTGENTVKLKIKYKSFIGDKTMEFDYRSSGKVSQLKPTGFISVSDTKALGTRVQ